ncbi:MAG: BTAD domain-containing putative transcriptional regulator [Stackebrandtia sp.]
MRFEALGPLRIRSGSGFAELSSVKRRALTAMLLCHAGRAVAPDTLLRTMWNGHGPDSGRGNLHWHVHQLRRILDDPTRLSRRDGGYVLRVDPEECDVGDFEAHHDAGMRAAADGDWFGAGTQFDQAERLWRGRAYEGLTDVPELRDEADRLTELRLTAAERRCEAGLNLGRHEELVPELTALVGEHPFREALRARLMLALYRCGRQADALRVYRHGRQRAVDELGLEPGPELVRLERAILNHEPRLDAPTPSIRTWSASRRSPAELPYSQAAFVGRAAESTRLCALLKARTGQLGGPVVVTGAVGVGTSALAIHVARQAAGDFPDGQLYADLRSAPDSRPSSPEKVLARFLRSLGVPKFDGRADRDELASRFRTAAAGRRLLIVLDNAESLQQVQPLLPADAGSAVVVTGSRSLAALPDADHLRLGCFDSTESAALLTRLLGAARTPEGSSVAKLARLCDDHPLALTIAASRLKIRPSWSLDVLTSRLEERGDDRLDAFAVDGLSLRDRFLDRYRTLHPSAARMFELLGQLDSASLTVEAAATLCDGDVWHAEWALERLADSGLVDCHGPDRYRIQELVRLFARERSAAEPSGANRGTTVAPARRLGAEGLADVLQPVELCRQQ